MPRRDTYRTIPWTITQSCIINELLDTSGNRHTSFENNGIMCGISRDMQKFEQEMLRSIRQGHQREIPLEI